jgi:hypothetical protein
MGCEFCGNDEGAYRVCLDCLAVQPSAVARALAEVLGGKPADWEFLAPSMTEAINR